MSNTTQKSNLQSLNTHMVIALISLFFTGFGMLILALVFILKLANAQNQIGFEISFLNAIIMVLLIFGFLLISLGVFHSMGLMSRINKLLDKAIETGTIGVTEPAQIIQTIAVPTANSVNSGVGGGLNIIRPPMPKASDGMVESAPVASTPKVTTNSSPAKTTSASVVTNAPTPKVATSKASSTNGELMSLDDGLQFIVDRYNTEKVKTSFIGWHHTLMMSFKDLGKSYLYTINGDQGIELKEGVDESAAVQVTMDSEIFQKMMSKQINPIKAYSSGGLEVKGEMKNMLKLKKLMF